MSTKELHGWDILARKAKTSEGVVFLVYRVIHRQGRVPETEYMRNSAPSTRRLRSRASRFRSREAAERAIARWIKQHSTGSKS